jgi:hypothetical protein
MLDALLARALYNKTGNIEAAHTEIPLLNTDGLWHGSISTMVGYRSRSAGATGGDPVVPQLIHFTKGFSITRDVHTLRGAFERYDPSRGPYNNYSDISKYKTHHDVYNSYAATRILFDGFGDGEKCADLINNYITFIGKKHSHGFGEIAFIDLEQTEDDVSVVNDGTAARNIPTTHASRYYNNPRGLQIKNRWKPPYWQGEEVDCICPPTLVPVKTL